MTTATSNARPTSMGQKENYAKVGKIQAGEIHAERLIERRALAIRAHLASNPTYAANGLGRVAYAVFLLVANKSAIYRKTRLSVNPYGIGRKIPEEELPEEELPRGVEDEKIFDSERLEYTGPYLRDCLLRMATIGNGDVICTYHASRGDESACKFSVGVIGPCLADILAEAAQSKTAAKAAARRGAAKKSNAKNPQVPPPGTTSQGGQNRTTQPAPSPQVSRKSRNLKLHEHGTDKQACQWPSVPVSAVPGAFRDIFEPLKTRLGQLDPVHPVQDSALISVLAATQVAPAEIMDLVEVAATLATKKTRNLLAHILSVLGNGPSNQALAESCRAILRQREAARTAQGASVPVPASAAPQAIPAPDAAAVEALIAAGVTQAQAPAMVAAMPPQVEGVERTYLIAQALVELRTRQGQVNVPSPGGLLRMILARDIHQEKFIRRARDLQEAYSRVEAATSGTTWEGVREPLRSDPTAQALWVEVQRLQATFPASEAPGYLDHFDAHSQATRQLVAHAEAQLGAEAETRRAALATRLAEAMLQEGTLVWRRAWDHHWSRVVCEAWGIPI